MLKIGSYWKKWNSIENYVFKKMWLFCKKKNEKHFVETTNFSMKCENMLKFGSYRKS